MGDEECPGEAACTRGTGSVKYIHQALVQISTPLEMAERMKNPPRPIVDKTCLSCELLPTKPGHEQVPPWLVAAANAANRVEVWTDAGITDTIYGGEISARVAAALEGVKQGRNRAQAARMKDKPTDAQQAASKNQQMLQSGEGVMDD